MKKFTVEEFQSDFDNIMERVENGESFIITNDDGKECLIIPYKLYKEVEDSVSYLTNHDDGC